MCAFSDKIGIMCPSTGPEVSLLHHDYAHCNRIYNISHSCFCHCYTHYGDI